MSAGRIFLSVFICVHLWLIVLIAHEEQTPDSASPEENHPPALKSQTGKAPHRKFAAPRSSPPPAQQDKSQPPQSRAHSNSPRSPPAPLPATPAATRSRTSRSPPSVARPTSSAATARIAEPPQSPPHLQ